MKCEVDKKKITIVTLPHMAASMINRALTTNTSKSLHETVLNYYVYTSICHPVNNIQDKEYIDFKTKFMRGDFAMAGDSGCIDIPEEIEPITYLKPVEGDGLWMVIYKCLIHSIMSGDIQQITLTRTLSLQCTMTVL
jgi:hypothetical protein